jgi:hypothetical protein
MTTSDWKSEYDQLEKVHTCAVLGLEITKIA